MHFGIGPAHRWRPALAPAIAGRIVRLRIARRCLFIVRGCLREEEWNDAVGEFYHVAREEMEAGTAELASEHAV